MVARLAGDFYPMDHELAMRPRIRRLFWHLTALWAALGLAKAGMTLWLLQSQSLETFILVKSISMLAINVLAAFATIGLASLVARKEGLMGCHAPGAVARRGRRLTGRLSPSGPRASGPRPRPSGRVASSSGVNSPSTRMKATRATVSPRLAHAWSVPRWTTTSPACSVTSESSRTSVISPSSTMP